MKDSSSDTSDDVTKTRSRFSKQSYKARTWIEEGGDDDIVDLMEPSVTRKLHSNIQANLRNRTRDKSPDFEINEDGKLIIEPLEKKRKKKREEMIEDEAYHDARSVCSVKRKKFKSKKN